jgi:hypothetical protein
MISDSSLNFCGSIIAAGDRFSGRSLDFQRFRLCCEQCEAPSKAFGFYERSLHFHRKSSGRNLFGHSEMKKECQPQNESTGPSARKHRASWRVWTKVRELRLTVTSPVIVLLSLLSSGWTKPFNPPSAFAREQPCAAVHAAPVATPFQTYPDGSFRRTGENHGRQQQADSPAGLRRATALAPAPAQQRAEVAAAPAVADAPLWNGRRAPPPCALLRAGIAAGGGDPPLCGERV